MKKTIAVIFRTFALIIGIASVQTLCGQVDFYSPGYIIKANGAKEAGFVNEDKDELLSRRILFKPNQEDKAPEKFMSGELEEFGFTNSGRRFHLISYTYVPRSGNDTLTEKRMAELLSDGEIDLFRLVRPNNEYFSKYQASYGSTSELLIAEKDGIYHRLEIVEKEITETTIRVVEVYKGYLRYLMSDWPAAENLIPSTNLKESEIQGLINKYNRFRDPEAVHYTNEKVGKEAKPSFHIYALGGPSMRIGSNDVSSSFAGLGVAFVFNPTSFSNALRISVGPEYLQAFNEPIPDFRLKGRPDSFIRIGLKADYFFTREGKVLPYMRVIASPFIMDAFRYGDVVERNTNLSALSFGGGLGLDVGRLGLVIQFDQHFGLQGGAAFKLY